MVYAKKRLMKAPYTVVSPDGSGKVRTLIEMFAQTFANDALRPYTICEMVDRECEGNCYRGDGAVITPHLVVRTPGMIWYGCVFCGGQVIIELDTLNNNFHLLPPTEQRDAVEKVKTPGRYKKRHSEPKKDTRPPRIVKLEQLQEQQWEHDMKKKYGA